MKRSLALGVLGLSASLAASGCALDNDFEGSTPTDQSVALNVPAGAATAQGALVKNDGVRRSALIGQVANSYRLTRGVTAVVNGGTGFILLLVKTIVSFPPTSVDGDTGVWGPHSEPLEPNAWRLTVKRLERHVFEWKLDAKDKMLPDSAFVTILSGMHTRATTDRGRAIEHFGSGQFAIDWDLARTLPEHNPNEYGRATFNYSRLPGQDQIVDVDFDGIRHEETGEIFDAIYRYRATPGAGGDLKYGELRDSLPEPGNTGTAAETLTLHSRWLETGAGRADYRTASDDVTATVGAPATVSECWSTAFLSQYMSISYAPTEGWGQEADCAFPTADFSAVAPSP